MGFSTWWLYLWPGLPGLWLRGQVRGLLVAILFTISLNLALVATFVWPEWFPVTLVAACWLVTAVIWIVSAWNSHNELVADSALPKNAASFQELLEAAQAHYLRRHWLEAETTLNALLEQQSDEQLSRSGIRAGTGERKWAIPARLMLAALLRRTQRWPEAQRQLDHLANLTERGKWDMEIRREQARLTELQQPVSEASSP